METKENNNGEMIVLAPIIQKYTFAKKFKGDNAREVYKAVSGRISKDFKNAPAFNGYFKFNDETQEINGSDLYHGILINDELRANGLHLPSIIEGKSLDSVKRLTNGVYRDYGLVIYSAQNPNSEIAQRLVKEASKKGLKLPILAHFGSLKLRKGGSKNGVSVLFGRETKDIMFEEEAQIYINEQFHYKGNSGVQWLVRGGGGDWVAGWGGLDNSYGDGGRVDWICGEATTQNLERVVLEEVNNASRKEMEKLNTKIANSKEAALKVLRS